MYNTLHFFSYILPILRTATAYQSGHFFPGTFTRIWTILGRRLHRNAPYHYRVLLYLRSFIILHEVQFYVMEEIFGLELEVIYILVSHNIILFIPEAFYLMDCACTLYQIKVTSEGYTMNCRMMKSLHRRARAPASYLV